MTINQLIKKIKDNNPDADTELVKLAYDFAASAHSGQQRVSGEPYINHCLHTAFVLAQLKADLNTIIAGLLHDVPEDTEYTLEQIEKNFGSDVASLVKGITKLGKIKYRGIERYRENLKKMFLAMAEDVRVIFIKFSDRLYNLQTLDSLPKNKQKRIAKETLEIYAPIADLLGIWRLKWQMEDLCFKYLYPEEYKKLEYKYEVEKKVENTQFIQKIKNILGKKLKETDVEWTIEGRFKHFYSIYKKMQKKERKFDEIYDVFALRIIVPTISDCYKTLGIIHSLWRPKLIRFKDYIAVPKPNGYQSLHTTVFGPNGKATEFQIRTQEMNDKALFGFAAHWHYKQFNKGTDDNQPLWIKGILEAQKDIKNTNDFLNELKSNVFSNRIFVFSPKGDVFELPERATPIDFAYAVHTDIGNKATAALVNDKMSTLDYEFKNGDLVEITVDKNRKTPNLDWIKFVKTKRAKDKIKQNSKKTAFSEIKRMMPGGKH